VRDVAITHGFAGVPVSDFSLAYGWYVRLFGRAADRFPRDGEAVWQLTATGSVYVAADPDRAGNGLLTLAVDDLDTYMDRLRSDGFALGEHAGGGVPRRVALTDRDGNTITLFQDPAGQAS
jgi:catechol 2,3-dioxygenase-like lactoylglutathione lyase family enzyme